LSSLFNQGDIGENPPGNIRFNLGLSLQDPALEKEAAAPDAAIARLASDLTSGPPAKPVRKRDGRKKGSRTGGRKKEFKQRTNTVEPGGFNNAQPSLAPRSVWELPGKLSLSNRKI